jgi:cbb3-type cytochrome oxidase maturation protein
MDILYLLIPLSAVLVLLILGVFAWATYSGQFEDVEVEGRRILASEPDRVDDHQSDVSTAGKQSPDVSSIRNPS